MPRMSPRVFSILIKNLPPERIRSINPEEVPEDLPANFVEQLPKDIQGAVEDLIFRTLGTEVEAEAGASTHPDGAVQRALEEAASRRMGAETGLFQEILRDYQELHAQRHGLTHKAFPSEDARRQIRLLDERLASKRKELQAQLDDLNRLRRSREIHIQTLKDRQPATADEATRLQQGRRLLERQLEDIDRLVAPFLVLVLRDADQTMEDEKFRIRRLENEAEQTDRGIERLKAETETLARKQNDLNSFKLYQQNQKRLAELYRERASKEIAVSEEGLTHWLDIFVDANVNPYAAQEVETESSRVKRNLFYLLSKYCEAQEESARSVANNTVVQVDARQAVQFILMSERIVLDYFAAKKKDYSKGISETAKLRLKAIEGLERDLMHELSESRRQAEERFQAELLEQSGSGPQAAAKGPGLLGRLRGLLGRSNRSQT